MLKKTLAIVAVALAFQVAPALAQIGPADAGTTKGGYNPATGEIIISGSTILNWVVQKNDGSNVFIIDNLTLPEISGGLYTRDPNVVGVGVFAPPGQTFADFNLGAIAPTGLTPGDFFIQSEANFGSPSIKTPLTLISTVIPEPASFALLGMVGLAGALVRRR